MINEQISLFNYGCPEKEDLASKYLLSSFSYNNFCADQERINLENKYSDLLVLTNTNNRQSVSFQLNKNNGVYGWFKYKEGFSPQLVSGFLDEMNLNGNDTLLDPFIGSGTTSLVGSQRGLKTVGIDVLSTSKLSFTAKTNINNYDIEELSSLIGTIREMKRPLDFSKRINWVNITKYAYPDSTDFDLRYLSDWIENTNQYSKISLNLLKLATVNSLEELSYTTKAGQYLKWDSRSKKIQERNEKRINKNLAPIKPALKKGKLPEPSDHIANKLKIMTNDIQAFQNQHISNNAGTFILDSVLNSLPKISENSISGTITSPPYLNRYDYTRTYALELAFLGLNDADFKNLRQQLISSTVENKSKIDWLRSLYYDLDKENDFKKIVSILNADTTLEEINKAMEKRKDNGDLNNKGVIRMVKGYFEELGFILFEMHRIMKKGALYYTVNDNVRFGGEVIPVDFISTSLAEKFGFKPIRIETISQQKGNSSQQMKKFGRVPLRKSITVWKNT